MSKILKVMEDVGLGLFKEFGVVFLVGLVAATAKRQRRSLHGGRGAPAAAEVARHTSSSISGARSNASSSSSACMGAPQNSKVLSIRMCQDMYGQVD